jgi:hypothetical protein
MLLDTDRVHVNHWRASLDGCSVAARTDTDEYPRSAAGRRAAWLGASLSDAFHAANKRPRASQLSEASRCWVHHAFLTPVAQGPANLSQGARDPSIIDVDMVRSSFGLRGLSVERYSRIFGAQIGPNGSE